MIHLDSFETDAFYDAKTLVILFLLIFVFVFGYYEIKLFLKTFKSIVIIFSTSILFLKSIDMF